MFTYGNKSLDGNCFLLFFSFVYIHNRSRGGNTIGNSFLAVWSNYFLHFNFQLIMIIDFKLLSISLAPLAQCWCEVSPFHIVDCNCFQSGKPIATTLHTIVVFLLCVGMCVPGCMRAWSYVCVCVTIWTTR